MSASVNAVKDAAAGLNRSHARVQILAASAVTASVLGAAGLAVGSAPWSAAAADATVHSGSQQATTHSGAAFDAQLDALRSAATGGSTAAHQPAKAITDSAKKAAPAKPAAVKKAAPAKHVAKKAAPAKRAAANQERNPYPIYDSVTPSALPQHKVAAVYVNGAYATSYSHVADQKSVLWIDTNGSNPGATVLDVEPGDATPHGAAVWVQQRLDRHPNSVAIVYTMRSSWQAVKANVAHLPKWQQDKVRYWIADPTGVQHMVPGANATQWYWGSSIDISMASPSLMQLG